MVISKINYHRKGEQKPIKLNLDLITYTIFCRYTLQPTSLVRMEHLVNLRKLINVIDYSTYENDPEKVKRVNFIRKALQARLDDNINDRDIILTYVNGGLSYPIDFLDYNRLDMSKDEIAYVHKLVSETLQYQFIYTKLDDIQDICTRIKMTDYANRGNIIQEFETVVDDLKNEFRRTKINDNSIDMTFSLQEGQFEHAITDTWNMITNPSRRLVTGMQGLNEMVGGGFESGRVYMLLGTSGVGKSITLLNLIYQIKRFNRHYKPKDPTKIPCILLLTMENTVVETITRLFDLVIENSHGMANYSLDQVINMLRTEGELVVNDSSPIDIVIKYKANKSVDTSYLYTICDDLDDQGYEVICLVQDHVKRIRSTYANSDIRLELGDIVNEFKVFAAFKDIPVITNSHLNRDAARILEDAARKANQDAGKLLGKSNIGESMLMIDNLDCGIIIALDFDREENRYMTFNLIKMRDKTDRLYIAQPFLPNSKIRLVEDMGGIPQFRDTIHGNPEIKRNTIIKISGASSINQNIDDLLDVKAEDLEDNTFKKQTYTLEEPTIPDYNKIEVVEPIDFLYKQNENISLLKNLLQERDKPLPPKEDELKKPVKFPKVVCPIIFESELNESGTE